MITDSFDMNTKAIVNLKDFYGEQKHIIEKCLIIFSHEIYKEILNKYKCREIAYVSSANGNNTIYSFEHNGINLGFYLSPIGSTLASQTLIEVNWLTGASKFVMFGSAGSLNFEITTNKYVIPTESYRDEGMSYHYAPPSDYIVINNHHIVAKIMKDLGVPYVEGKIWTTDAFLRETAGQIAKRKNEGCIAVEMEVAGVQSVCNFHNLELYNFLVTGDVLTETDYNNALLHNANHNFEKLYLAIEIAEKI